jgi:6-phosphofructokinase 2
MTPILTVTLNPALDLATSAEAVRPGPKLRCDEPRADPGGGGINVSRMIQRLGGQARAFVALGGATGVRLAGLLEREGIACVPFTGPGETRESLSVTDRTSGGQYRFVMPGPHWTKTRGEAATRAVVRAAGAGAIVVLSGSLPTTCPRRSRPGWPGVAGDSCSTRPGRRSRARPNRRARSSSSGWMSRRRRRSPRAG